jgi:hypothetical protein
MKYKKPVVILFFLVITYFVPICDGLSQGTSYDTIIWESIPPYNCPFEISKDLNVVMFTGRSNIFDGADTWYPTWASNDILYSPWTDGSVNGVGSNSSAGPNSTTGAARLIGNDPLNLKVENIGLHTSSAFPYVGRYPCGSLVYNNVWYYGTNCVDLDKKKEFPYLWGGFKEYPTLMCMSKTRFDGTDTCESINYIGPTVGFRYSTDFGKTWVETTHTPANPIFNDPEKPFLPTKIGAAHFVDFGKNMEYSPDGRAYLVAHGSIDNDSFPKNANASWITGDAIYLLRVIPSIKNINDIKQYEFFCGYDNSGKAKWSNNFKDIKPLIEWNNNCGCVTMTYNRVLKKYLMCVTTGTTTVSRYDTYIIESDKIAGPFKLVSYMKNFGEQAYFVNIPSKFIQSDGKTMWMVYSANYTNDFLRHTYKKNPPTSAYGLNIHEIKIFKK